MNHANKHGKLLDEFFNVAASQDAQLLDGDLPKEVASLLSLHAWDLSHSEDKRRRRLPNPWTAKWHRSPKTGSVEGTTLHELLQEAMKIGFMAAVSRYSESIRQRVESLQRAEQTRKQRRENGQILAAEGREKRKPKTDARTAKLCRIYKRLRPQYPAGGQGNADTLREVSREFGPLPDKHKTITVQAIRKALKRGGVDCR